MDFLDSIRAASTEAHAAFAAMPEKSAADDSDVTDTLLLVGTYREIAEAIAQSEHGADMTLLRAAFSAIDAVHNGTDDDVVRAMQYVATLAMLFAVKREAPSNE